MTSGLIIIDQHVAQILYELNYDSNATEDDNSCLILGCTDSIACNYDPGATLDNSGCEYPTKNSIVMEIVYIQL